MSQNYLKSLFLGNFLFISHFPLLVEIFEQCVIMDAAAFFHPESVTLE